MTKLEIIGHIADLCTSENGWHDGAVSSHILATLLNKYYRKSIPWLQKYDLVKLCIKDYCKVTKMAHELIRRMSVDWDGTKLSEAERAGK